MSNQSKATKFIVFTGVLAAIAIVLYFIEIPVIPGSGYLKIDASDIPAAVAGVMMGPAAAVLVELIKVIVHVVAVGFGSTMGFGDLVNFIVGSCLTAAYALVWRSLYKRGRKKILSAVVAGIAGMAAMVAAGIIGNYLIAPPYFDFMLHLKLSGAALWAAIGGATVLNVIKAALLLVVMLPLSSIFKKRIGEFGGI